MAEALAVQLSERSKVELPDVVPKKSERYVVNRAFEKSLLWRDQAFFSTRTWQLATKLLGPDDATELAINIATEPKNPYNALRLHASLSKSSMPERDQRWSTYIAHRQIDEDNAIGNLIGWAFDQGLDEIDDDRAELAAITLAWLLTTSSRVVRDRATKALACVVTGRLELAAKLLDHFAGVDDLYLRERLLGAIYGATLQGAATSGLSALAEKVYTTTFATGSPPLNALLREHAMGIVLYAKWRGELPPSVDASKVVAPYESPWPLEHVSKEQVETYKQDYGGGVFHDDIASSAGLGGDFGRYILPRVADRFSPALRGQKLLSPKEVFDDWLSGFNAAASGDQLAAFVALLEATKECLGQAPYADTPERKARDKAEEAFKATVSSNEWNEFEVRALDYAAFSLFDGRRGGRTLAEFNIGWASRWVIKRAHDFGWTAARFGNWERDLRGSSRTDHEVERVGKKYQWLAINELAARLGDHLAFKGGIYSPDDEGRTYRGAFDVSLRDIDPSLLVTKTEYDGWKEWPKTWWMPAEPDFQCVPPAERLAWRDTEDDIFNDASLIDVANPQDGRRWLVLHTFGD